MLETQWDVDNFQLNHGPCDRVENLRVRGADIANLDGLFDLTSVGGLWIDSNPALTNINGLANLTSEGATLWIDSNAALTNINGLANLTSVGDLRIRSNAALTNIDGLAKLTSVGSNLVIVSNEALTNIDSLANLISVGWSLAVISNSALTNINGLANLASVGGSLTILSNDLLTNIDRLANLTYVGHRLRIDSNEALTNIDGLASLTSLRGDLTIGGNEVLTNIDGLANLTSVGWNLGIHGNAALTNIDGLANLTSVGIDLRINQNAALSNIDGLANLTSVGRELYFRLNAALTNVDGLSAVTSVGGDLSVWLHESLSRCEGLSRLIDQWDDAEPGPGPGAGGVPDVGGAVYIGNNLTGCNSTQEILATVINAGHAGAWFNPETPGQGQLVDVEPESKFLFLSWFTFTDTASADPNEQHWFTAQGNYSGDTAELLVYETLGGQFDDPQEVSTAPVGIATLSFSDCGNGQLDYAIDTWGLEDSFPLQRVIPGTENVCEERAGISTEPLAPDDGRDGAWYEAASPGQGFVIDAHPGNDFIFVAWFTYGEDTASGQRWLTAQGPLGGSTADMVVYETVGGSFDNPKLSETNSVGTMTIDFTDCSNAQLTYSLPADPAEGDIAITRVIPGSQALCEELTGAN